MIWAVRWNCSTSFRLCILPQPVQQVYAPMVETEVPKEAEAEHIPKQCMFLFESVLYDQILYPRKVLIIFDWLSCLKIIELISCVWCTGQGRLSVMDHQRSWKCCQALQAAALPSTAVEAQPGMPFTNTLCSTLFVALFLPPTLKVI